MDAVLAATDYSSAESRTVEQLVEYRLMPKWDKHYSRLDQAGPIRKPVGVLVAMLRRDNECQDPRCDERTNVDTGLPCVSCEQRGIDKRAERAAAAPTPAAETAAPAPTPPVPPKRPATPVPAPREAVITEVSEQQRSLARQALMNRPRTRR
ncbi:hypothetical protein D3C59_32875 [Streptomyces sp. SHP22-7]|nr:hypothetical protein D3C59_32875 [Streptomyces sp. SHP22-7]